MNINSRFKPSYQSPGKGQMFQYTRGTEVYLMCEVGDLAHQSRFVQLTGCGTGTTMCAPKRTYIKVWCAWCGKYLRTIPGHGQSGDSHGICPKCAKKQAA